MKDVLDKLADDVRLTTLNACLKVVDLHLIGEIRPPDNLYQKGYNDALRDVSEKIARLK